MPGAQDRELLNPSQHAGSILRSARTAAADYHPDDPDLEQARQRNEERFGRALGSIFEKYGKDFEGVGDEIDLLTGEIIVNNGHLERMQHEQDSGLLEGVERRLLSSMDADEEQNENDRFVRDSEDDSADDYEDDDYIQRQFRREFLSNRSTQAVNEPLDVDDDEDPLALDSYPRAANSRQSSESWGVSTTQPLPNTIVKPADVQPWLAELRRSSHDQPQSDDGDIFAQFNADINRRVADFVQQLLRASLPNPQPTQVVQNNIYIGNNKSHSTQICGPNGRSDFQQRLQLQAKPTRLVSKAQTPCRRLREGAHGSVESPLSKRRRLGTPGQPSLWVTRKPRATRTRQSSSLQISSRLNEAEIARDRSGKTYSKGDTVSLAEDSNGDGLRSPISGAEDLESDVERPESDGESLSLHAGGNGDDTDDSAPGDGGSSEEAGSNDESSADESFDEHIVRDTGQVPPAAEGFYQVPSSFQHQVITSERVGTQHFNSIGPSGSVYNTVVNNISAPVYNTVVNNYFLVPYETPGMDADPPGVFSQSPPNKSGKNDPVRPKKSRTVHGPTRAWKPEEDELLIKLIEEDNARWVDVLSHFPDATIKRLQYRYYKVLRPNHVRYDPQFAERRKDMLQKRKFDKKSRTYRVMDASSGDDGSLSVGDDAGSERASVAPMTENRRENGLGKSIRTGSEGNNVVELSSPADSTHSKQPDAQPADTSGVSHHRTRPPDEDEKDDSESEFSADCDSDSDRTIPEVMESAPNSIIAYWRERMPSASAIPGSESERGSIGSNATTPDSQAGVKTGSSAGQPQRGTCSPSGSRDASLEVESVTDSSRNRLGFQLLKGGK